MLCWRIDGVGGKVEWEGAKSSLEMLGTQTAVEVKVRNASSFCAANVVSLLHPSAE